MCITVSICLLVDTCDIKVITVYVYVRFAGIVELAQDLACDVPHIYKYLGEVLGLVVFDGTLPLDNVKDILEPLVRQNKAGLVMAETLLVAVKKAGVWF